MTNTIPCGIQYCSVSKKGTDASARRRTPATGRVADILDALPPLALFSATAVATTAFEPWLRYGAALLSDLRLSPRLREIAVLEVARSSGCEYELAQHRVIGQAAGLTAHEISEIEGGRGPALEGADGAVAELARAAVIDVRASAGTLDRAQQHLDPRELVELLLVAGHYRSIAMLAETLVLPPDPSAGVRVVEAAGTLKAEA
jgi:AhpD family alkylhydroperoxidase